MDGYEQYPPEGDDQGNENEELWKKFGRGNEVGNMLYSMYSQKQKPKINYPAVKTKKKPTPAEELKMGKAKGPCPQKAVIEYPDMPSKSKYKFHPVDFIPRKKHGDEILGELEKEKNKPPVAYGKRPQNREAMIEELQEIHRFGDKRQMDQALKEERDRRERILAAAKNMPPPKVR